jgi:hypothetical protein
MRLYPKSQEEAQRWKEDYEFIGYEAYFDKDALVVVDRRKKPKKNKNDKNQKKSRRRD